MFGGIKLEGSDRGCDDGSYETFFQILPGGYHSKKNIDRGPVLLAEQKVKHTFSVATRAYVLENGRISMEGKGQDFLNNEHVRKAYPGIKKT